MASKLKKKWDSLSERVQNTAKMLGAIATIIGIIVASSTWLTSQIDGVLEKRIDQQTEQLQENVNFLLAKTDKHEEEAELQMMRMEILVLIDTDPTNTVEIKKLYQEYRNKNGNHYVASVIQRWCEKYYPKCDL